MTLSLPMAELFRIQKLWFCSNDYQAYSCLIPSPIVHQHINFSPILKSASKLCIQKSAVLHPLAPQHLVLFAYFELEYPSYYKHLILRTYVSRPSIPVSCSMYYHNIRLMRYIAPVLGGEEQLTDAINSGLQQHQHAIIIILCLFLRSYMCIHRRLTQLPHTKFCFVLVRV